MSRPPYIFTYPGKCGPVVRTFTSPTAFEAWVIQWRQLVGVVEWPNPFLAKGAPVEG